jgi:hypothetical protein
MCGIFSFFLSCSRFVLVLIVSDDYNESPVGLLHHYGISIGIRTHLNLTDVVFQDILIFLAGHVLFLAREPIDVMLGCVVLELIKVCL